LKVYAFGDESCGLSAISYGVLLAPKQIVPKLEQKFALTKIAFGGRSWDELHCNQLLNSGDRARGAWSHLTYEDIFALFDRVCADLNELGSQRVACIFDRSRGAQLAEALKRPWTDADGNEVEPAADFALPGDKGIVVLCAIGLLRPILDGMEGSSVTFIPDPDGASRIAWGSEIKRVEYLIANGSFDTRGKFRYIKVRPPKPPLLQIADIIAYVSQRACRDNGSETTLRFKTLAQRLITATYQFEP
jgi:hypothetical protein